MDNTKIKFTNQRIEILDFLKNNTNHPTVEEVYEAVKKKLSRISKATVYQNLKFLTEKGMIQEVNIKGVSRFEPNITSHHHLICRKCGKIIDFKSQELTEYSLNIGKKLKEIDIDATHTNFYGICKKCTLKKF
ncbi:MAG: transcriptional repressor [Candidatus Thermoplasmatota archaeon]|nr:transcriptional repressor [Candidatus Thermoplasmatota archaeon]